MNHMIFLSIDAIIITTVKTRTVTKIDYIVKSLITSVQSNKENELLKSILRPF